MSGAARGRNILFMRLGSKSHLTGWGWAVFLPAVMLAFDPFSREGRAPVGEIETRRRFLIYAVEIALETTAA